MRVRDIDETQEIFSGDVYDVLRTKIGRRATGEPTVAMLFIIEGLDKPALLEMDLVEAEEFVASLLHTMRLAPATGEGI